MESFKLSSSYCSIHENKESYGVCLNNSCNKKLLYCDDCFVNEHNQHLSDTIIISDLELCIDYLITLKLFKNDSIKQKNSIRLVQELIIMIKQIQCQQDQLTQLIITNNQISQNIEQFQNQCSIQEQFQQQIENYQISQQNIESQIQKSLDTSLLQQKQQCQNCKQELEQCEIQVDEENIICYNCIEISKNSSLRKELIAFIKLKFATKTKQADNNNKTIYFICDLHPQLNLPDYLGYIIGYNHPLFKDKIQIDPKTYRITQGQADKYLETDLDQFEIQLYEFYQRNNRKIEDIPENIRMLMLSVLFIFKDFATVKNLAFLQTFNHLYMEIEKFLFPKTKGTNILKTQIYKVLDFFKDRFHRRDGTVRQQYFINDLRKILPIKKRI